MASKQQASKRAVQNLNNSNLCTPVKAVKTEIPKPNTPENRMDLKGDKEVDM